MPTGSRFVLYVEVSVNCVHRVMVFHQGFHSSYFDLHVYHICLCLCLDTQCILHLFGFVFSCNLCTYNMLVMYVLEYVSPSSNHFPYLLMLLSSVLLFSCHSQFLF